MEKRTNTERPAADDGARPRRSHARARAEMREGILRVGGELLEKDGPAGLSVREIARGLGVASSAIYRHVSSRDDLLTLLLEDAFTDLAQRVDAALGDAALPGAARPGADAEGAESAGDAPGGGLGGRSALAALAGTMRTWAVEQPQRWALVYGTPVPGYAAPAERTTGPGTRVMARFLGILARGGSGTASTARGAASTAGKAASADARGRSAVQAPGEAYSAVLADGVEALGVDASPQLAAAGVLAWTGLVGLISAQLFGQLGEDFAPHGEEMLAQWVDATAEAFGLR